MLKNPSTFIFSYSVGTNITQIHLLFNFHLFICLLESFLENLLGGSNKPILGLVFLCVGKQPTEPLGSTDLPCAKV